MGRLSQFSPAPLSKVRFAGLLGLALLGCSPEIGDECTTSTDCSQSGDRLCDISQPDGYCTVFNCEPSGSNAASKCPDEAACVVFAVEPSPVEGCENHLGSTPYQRSFCMKRCDNGSDCRPGYECRQADGDHWQGLSVDGSTKVCTVAANPPPPAPLSGDGANVCTGTSEELEPDDGAGGDGGAGGQSSMPDMSGGGASN